MPKIKRFIKLVAPLLLILIGGSWLPDGLKDGQLEVTVAGFVIFISASWWVYVQRREYFFVHISAKKKIRPHAVLLMPISPLRDLARLRKIENGYVFDDTNLKSSLAGLAEQSLSGFPWQQTMRGIAEHQKELKRIYLIGSKGGSFSQLKDCENFIKHYLPNLDVQCWEEGVDFENLEELLDELDAAIKHAGRAYRLSDIMLDVTAGQKTISIAAALVTLNRRELEFQYVSTTPPHSVIAFNTNAEKREIET